MHGNLKGGFGKLHCLILLEYELKHANYWQWFLRLNGKSCISFSTFSKHGWCWICIVAWAPCNTLTSLCYTSPRSVHLVQNFACSAAPNYNFPYARLTGQNCRLQMWQPNEKVSSWVSKHSHMENMYEYNPSICSQHLRRKVFLISAQGHHTKVQYFDGKSPNLPCLGWKIQIWLKYSSY